MNLTIIFVLTICISANAEGFSQRIHFSEKDVPLKEVFKVIQAQTGFTFVYTNGLLKKSSNVSINVMDTSLADFLSLCFKDQPLDYTLINNMVVVKERKREAIITVTASAPVQVALRGKILNEKGEPLGGATIIEKGTSNSTTSNATGNFVIQVADNKVVLLISFVGYQNMEVSAAGRNNLSITLSLQDAGMNDVVVVGYGRQKRNNVVGAVATLQNDELMRSNAPSISNSLSGRVAGIIAIQRGGEPGNDDAELLIRGRATLNDNGPLIMVDGIQRDLSQLNPNEIASISVLKDASATAIYGTRGANGVLLVTTKRGVSGKSSFSYNANAGFENVINTPQYLNAYDFARLHNRAQLNDDPSLSPDDLQYSEDDILKYKEHSSPFTHPDVDWWKEVIQPNAIQQKHSLAVSGGSNDFKYFISFGYLNQEGIYRSNNLKRYNSRINIDANLTPSTTVAIGISGDVEKISRPGTFYANEDKGVFSQLSFLPPNSFPVRNEDGTWASNDGQNPVADASMESGFRSENPLNLQSSISLNQRLDFMVKGLSLKFISAYDLGYSNYKDWFTPYLAYNNGQVLNDESLPRLFEGFGKYNNQTFETHLNYLRSFNKHDVSGLLLYTQTASYSNNINASRTDFVSPALPQLFAGPRTNIDNNGSASEGGREGYLGRFTYAFDKKYFAEVSFGYNGSENFPEGNRFGFFPALALGWNIKREHFFDQILFVDNFKLRASYGEVGNDRVGGRRFLYRSQVGFSGDDYVFGGSNPVPVQVIEFGGLPNIFVTWERAKKSNVGLDVDMMNYKFGLKLDVFFEKRDNILASRNASVPAYFGATLPVENIGKVDNSGFEAELRYKNSIGAFSYYVNVNYTFAQNKVRFIDEPENVPSYQKRAGYPIGQFYGFVVNGLYQTPEQINDLPKIFDAEEEVIIEPKLGQFIYKDINLDGVIDRLDQTAIGKSETPQSIYGLTLGADFKGIDINMLWQGASGFSVMRNDEAFYEFAFGGKAFNYVKDNWTPDNPNASYPRLSLTDNSYKREISSYWTHEANYLRLKSIEIGYTFPSRIFPRNAISKLRIYVSGTNMLTFSKEKDFDPESRSGQPLFYPITKLTSVGINLSF